MSQHIALLDEMSRLIEKRDLMTVSMVEQNLACNNDPSNHYKELTDLFSSPKIDKNDKIRLLMIYALRYENSSSSKITELIDLLFQNGVDRESIALVGALKRYAGSAQRTGDLFGNKDLITIVAKSLQKGLQGARNIYTQHQPFIIEILTELLRGGLKESEFPLMGGPGQLSKEKPQDIIVFIAGGATYEEALHIAQFNQTTPNVRVVLGGSTIHNSQSFLAEVAKLRDFATNYFGVQ